MSIMILPLAVTGIDLGLYMGLAGLAAGVFFGGLGMYFYHRRQAMWHETARIALEKGQPLPPMTDDMRPQPVRAKADNDVRSGLVLIAVGVGLYLFLNALAGRGLGLVGAIPGFIGIALLLYALLNAIIKGKAKPSVDRPPQS